MTPTVSVILPVHNGGDFLAAAVSSILSQSFRRLELLLVDDRSDDGAIARLDVADERLYILSSRQTGVAGAFNYGLAHARGKFIARMDADDISLPERLEQQLNYLEFQAAKAYFLVRQRLCGRPLVIWGAGPTGTLMHDLLESEGAVIRGFLEVHPRRIGGRKRGLPVWPIEQVTELNDAFVLVAVGAAGAREEIAAYMLEHGKKEGPDYLFVA